MHDLRQQTSLRMDHHHREGQLLAADSISYASARVLVLTHAHIHTYLPVLGMQPHLVDGGEPCLVLAETSTRTCAGVCASVRTPSEGQGGAATRPSKLF